VLVAPTVAMVRTGARKRLTETILTPAPLLLPFPERRRRRIGPKIRAGRAIVVARRVYRPIPACTTTRAVVESRVLKLPSGCSESGLKRLQHPLLKHLDSIYTSSYKFELWFGEARQSPLQRCK
jgi:hypothetical protein